MIDHYDRINIIKNYNISNNLFSNAQFELNESSIYFSDGNCISSNINMLISFYMNTNHISTEKTIKYFITKKNVIKK